MIQNSKKNGKRDSPRRERFNMAADKTREKRNWNPKTELKWLLLRLLFVGSVGIDFCRVSSPTCTRGDAVGLTEGQTDHGGQHTHATRTQLHKCIHIHRLAKVGTKYSAFSIATRLYFSLFRLDSATLDFYSDWGLMQWRALCNVKKKQPLGS